MEDKIIEFTRDYYWHLLSPDGFGIEHYVSRGEELEQSDIRKILESEKPMDTLDEITEELLRDKWDYETTFWSELKAFCERNKFDYEEATDVVNENFYWFYPDSFLNPKFNAVIRVNAGDWNYEWTLHNVCNYYATGEPLHKGAGLYWLAKQQKRLTLLQKAIKDSDRYSNGDCEESKFVASSITELVNLPGPMGALTFLVSMNLLDAIAITEAVCRIPKEYMYQPPELKSLPLGYIALGKNTYCGLYDAYEGGGSLMEIELERDVKLPIHYIFDITTDNRIQDVYGMSYSCWKDSVIEVKVEDNPTAWPLSAKQIAKTL